MAIAYDTAGTVYSGTTSATVTLTAGASNNVAVMFVWFNDTAASFSSITVAGSSTGVTQVGSTYEPVDGEMRMYYLVNPPTSSSNYVVNISGTPDGMMWAVAIYSGVDTSTPIDSSNVGEPTSPYTISTTVVASGCWLVSHARRYGGSTGPTFDSGTGRSTISNQQTIGDSNGTVGTGSQSLSYSSDATSVMTQIVSLKPAGSSINSGFFNFM